MALSQAESVLLCGDLIAMAAHNISLGHIVLSHGLALCTDLALTSWLGQRMALVSLRWHIAQFGCNCLENGKTTNAVVYILTAAWL